MNQINPSRQSSSAILRVYSSVVPLDIIIHEFDDKYLPDPPTKDAPGGPRIACGVVVKE